MVFSNKTPQSGYDFPPTGLDDGTFTSIHTLALTCISISLLSAIFTVIANFISKPVRTFFSWQKRNRLVVYLAVSDGVFNLVHSFDHAQILITRDHVRPHDVCVFYAAIMGTFVTAQIVVVNIISINAFMLMYMKKNVNFGRYDYKFLICAYVLPFIWMMVFLSIGTLGPSGLFCGFDRMKGKKLYPFIFTLPMCIVLVVNCVLYTLIWIKIRKEENAEITTDRGSNRAARSITLFIAAFVIQWSFMGIWAVLSLVHNRVPPVWSYLFTTFSNIGGLINGIVYIIMRRRQRVEVEVEKNTACQQHHPSPKPTEPAQTTDRPVSSKINVAPFQG